MDDFTFPLEDKEVKITNPDKVLWEDPGITKLGYIEYLMKVVPYILTYSKDRLLTMIRYPHGIGGKSFYQKEIPEYAPQWIERVNYGNKNWILLNEPATLVWVANQGALELHLPFNLYFRENKPQEIIIDLDPMDTENFQLVREVALKSKEVLNSLGLWGVAKTSGATGLQIYIPIEPRYSYEEVRLINTFIAKYIAEKNPHQVTLERSVKKRGNLLYFDYLQLWKGKTLPAPYSVRARPGGSVSTPLNWEEVEKDIVPSDFNMETVAKRIKEKGDLFKVISQDNSRQNLDGILASIKKY